MSVVVGVLDPSDEGEVELLATLQDASLVEHPLLQQRESLRNTQAESVTFSSSYSRRRRRVRCPLLLSSLAMDWSSAISDWRPEPVSPLSGRGHLPRTVKSSLLSSNHSKLERLSLSETPAWDSGINDVVMAVMVFPFLVRNLRSSK